MKHRCRSIGLELEVSKGDIDSSEPVIPNELEINLPPPISNNTAKFHAENETLEEVPANKLQLLKEKRKKKDALNASKISNVSFNTEEKVKIADFLKNSNEKEKTPPTPPQKIISKETKFYYSREMSTKNNNENVFYHSVNNKNNKNNNSFQKNESNESMKLIPKNLNESFKLLPKNPIESFEIPLHTNESFNFEHSKNKSSKTTIIKKNGRNHNQSFSTNYWSSNAKGESIMAPLNLPKSVEKQTKHQKNDDLNPPIYRHEENLYLDALRRLEKTKSFKQNREVEHERQERRKIELQNKSKISLQETYMNKITKQFVQVVENLSKILGKNLDVIDYLTMCKILEEMGFLEYNSFTLQNNKTFNSYFLREKADIAKIWTILKGEVTNGVTKENLCRFFLSIMGVNVPSGKKIIEENKNFILNSLENCSGALTLAKDKVGGKDLSQFEDGEIATPYKGRKMEEELRFYKTIESNFLENNWNLDELYNFDKEFLKRNNNDINFETEFSFGRFNSEGVWLCSQNETRKIHQEFEAFYRNRLKNQIQKKPEIAEIEEHKPKILNNSRAMANNYWQKIVETSGISATNKKLSHLELLNLHKVKNKERTNQELARKSELEIKDCTFHPKVNAFHERSRSALTKPIEQHDVALNKPYLVYQHNKDKNEYMHLLSQPKTKGEDKKTEDLEFLKVQNECTFTPVLKNSKKTNNILDTSNNTCSNLNTLMNNGNSSKEKEEKHINKYLERMQIARIEKQMKKNFEETGLLDRKKIKEFNKILGNTSTTNNSDNHKKPNHNRNNSSINNISHNSSMNNNNSSFIKEEEEKEKFNEKNKENSQVLNKLKNDIKSEIEKIHKESKNSSSNSKHNKFNSSLNYKSNDHKGDHKFYYSNMINKNYNNLKEENKLNISGSNFSNEETPILILDINISKDKSEKVCVYKSSDPEKLALDFAFKHRNKNKKIKIIAKTKTKQKKKSVN